MFIRHRMLFSVMALSLTAALQAQPPAPTVPKWFPTLTTVANIGGKPGTTVDLNMSGTNLLEATAIWTSFGGTTTIPDGQKDPAKLNVKFDIPKEAAIGLHTFRVATKLGISNIRPFVIDELPELAEKDNTNKAAPQAVTAPCVILGTATAEVSDYYKVMVKAGETLTFELLARRIGSPLDPILFLSDVTGKAFPALSADDSPGLQSDARLTHTFHEAGDIIVEVRDTTFRGGADFAYRLRIGAFPGATTAFPLAIEHDKSVAIGFSGTKLEGVKPETRKGIGQVMSVVPRRDSGVAGWPVPVLVNAQPELVEAEPNKTIGKANPLPVPGGISARFAEKSDLDLFKITAKKDAKYEAVVQTYELNAPTEVYLRVLDAKGAELAKSNPTQLTTRVEFTAPADGDIILSCEHTNFLHGPNEVYHLDVKPLSPDFALSVPFDRIAVPQGGLAVVPVTGVTKLHGFNAPLDLSFAGSDAISGKFTLPVGVNPQPAEPRYLVLSAKPDAKLGAIIGTLNATATVDGKPVSHVVSFLDDVKSSLANMPTPPRECLTRFAIAVIPPTPFMVEVKFEKSEVKHGSTLKGKIIAKRNGKMTSDIKIEALTLPPTSVPKFNVLNNSQSESECELTIPATVPVGTHTVLLKATARINNKDHVVVVAPVVLSVLAK